jgi:hypothetical protein
MALMFLMCRFRATEAKTRNNDPKAMRGRMSAMQRGEDDGQFDELSADLGKGTRQAGRKGVG